MEPKPDNQWRPCPKGEFARLNERLSRRRQRRVMLLTAGCLGAAGLVAAVGISLFPVPQGQGAAENQAIAPISCRRVLESADAFAHHSLEPQIRSQILAHLKRCGSCEHKYRDMGLLS